MICFKTDTHLTILSESYFHIAPFRLLCDSWSSCSTSIDRKYLQILLKIRQTRITFFSRFFAIFSLFYHYLESPYSPAVIHTCWRNRTTLLRSRTPSPEWSCPCSRTLREERWIIATLTISETLSTCRASVSEWRQAEYNIRAVAKVSMFHN